MNLPESPPPPRHTADGRHSRYAPANWLDQPATRRLLFVIALLVTLTLLVQMLWKAYRPQGYDFTSYLLSARALLEGSDPYSTGTKFPYIYPLFLAGLLIPALALPYWLANVLWFGLNLAALAYICRAATREHPAWVVPVVLGLLVFSNPLHNHLLNGQVNLIVVSLCVAALGALERQRRVLTAALLGAAIALKLVPAILLMALVLRRELLCATLTVLFAALFAWVPAVTFLGAEAGTVYAEYGRTFLAGTVVTAAALDPMFFSLSGFVSRLAGEEIQLRALRLIATAVVAVLLATFEWRARRRGQAPPLLHVGSLYLVAALLVSPVSETHHLVLALPATLVLASSLLNDVRSTSFTVLLCFATFCAALPLARLDKHGPWFFLALTLLFLLVGRQLSARRT